MRVALVLLLAACGKDPDPPDTNPGTDTDTDVPAAEAPTCAADLLVPAVLHCTWTSAAAGAGHLEVALDGEVVRTSEPGPSGTTHEARVDGLKAGRTYTVNAYAGDVALEPVDHTVSTPPWAPSTTVTGTPSHPFVLTSLITLVDGSSRPVILDADGDLVWWTATDPGVLITTTRLSRDGRSVLFATYDIKWSEDIGTIHRVALDGTSVSETRALLAHHDFQEHDDGTFSWIGYEYRDFGAVPWASDVIRRGPEGASTESGSTITWSWFDGYGQNPWLVEDADNVALGNAQEWTHSNSLMVVDGFDGFFMMSKFLDTVLKIDASGTLVWEMGGKYSDFTNEDGSPVFRSIDDLDLWSHAHMSHFWEDGLLVFDNGKNNGPTAAGLSRVVEYGFDEAAKTVWEAWVYEEPTGKHTNLMGDARKLDNGNVLIGWSDIGYINEVDTAGNELWRLSLTGAIPSRITPLDAL